MLTNSISEQPMTVNIPPEVLAAAYRTVKAEYGRLSSFHFRAVVRASVYLDKPECWTWDGTILRSKSDTRPGITYRTSQSLCDCPAGSHGVPCWHVALRMILQEADKHTLSF